MKNREKVTSIVCKSLTIERISEDHDLIETGLLDSMALVQLMMELEEGFNITIAPEELDIEDYRSIKTICEMIERIREVPGVKKYA